MYEVKVGYKGCCGFLELHDFGSGYHDVSGDTPNELLENLKHRYNQNQLFHIWFNDESGGDEDDGDYSEDFVWPELMKAISKLPGVVDLGLHVNPNSGNRIQGYMWPNQKD